MELFQSLRYGKEINQPSYGQKSENEIGILFSYAEKIVIDYASYDPDGQQAKANSGHPYEPFSEGIACIHVPFLWTSLPVNIRTIGGREVLRQSS